jgi:hypothetical protein
MEQEDNPTPSQAEIDEENRRARRLRLAVSLALEVIARGEVPYEEAVEIVNATRKVAVNLFPGKGGTFDLLYRPKFDRLMREVYRIQ